MMTVMLRMMMNWVMIPLIWKWWKDQPVIVSRSHTQSTPTRNKTALMTLVNFAFNLQNLEDDDGSDLESADLPHLQLYIPHHELPNPLWLFKISKLTYNIRIYKAKYITFAFVIYVFVSELKLTKANVIYFALYIRMLYVFSWTNHVMIMK
jgi:hypothetical protein